MIKKAIIAGALVALVSGCQTMKKEEPVNLNGSWKIVSIMGEKTADFSPAELTFAKDGKLNGNNSCNNFFATYTQNGNQLTINLGGSTMKACVDTLMAQEQLVTEALPNVAQIKLENSKLELQNAKGKTLLSLKSVK